MQLNITAQALARDLMVGPMCTTRMTQRLCAYLGLDDTALIRAARTLSQVWARIASTQSAAANTPAN